MVQTDILSLPNEVLISIFELKNPQTGDVHRELIPSLRLTCRRFCVLSSHLLLKAVHVDISQPDTLTRLQGIAAQPNIARGVREVYIRLHFYHPWVAASLQNFVESVQSEWQQRTSFARGFSLPKDGYMDFEQIALCFLSGLHSLGPDKNGTDDLEISGDASSEIGSLRPLIVCSDAYKVYRSQFQAQDRMMSNGKFASILAQSLAKLVNFTNLTLHDRELYNNWSPGARVSVDSHDYLGQEKALVRVLSRPMLWEDVRWIRPTRDFWDAVPVNLLVDIPLAIGNRKDIYINYLSILVSAAPNYTRLPSDQDILASLSAAIDQISIFQLVFKPCCRGGCGPSVDDDDGNEIVRMSEAEIQPLDRYVGALLHSSNLGCVEIDLAEFWISAGFDSVLGVPGRFGYDWYFKPGSEIWSICLREVPITMQGIQRLAAALCDDGDANLYLHNIPLRDGTWKQTLDVLQRIQGRRGITVEYPVYDETGTLFDGRQI